jgi:hypothetical protein
MEVLNAYRKYHNALEPTKLLDKQMDDLEGVFNG